MAIPTESQACLIVFAKTPIRGSVKTRMRPFLSEEDCLQLHSLLLRLWVGRLRDWDLGQVHKALFLTALDAGRAAPHLLDVPPGVAVETQQGSDLGDRLFHAFDHEWNEGFRKIVFIGTDSPALRIEDLRAAFKALDESEVVLGPATDGGYYLIGFSACLPILFSGISWGTSQVFRETVQLLETNAIRWKCLGENFDLDTYEDLVNFHHLSKEFPIARDSEELAAFVARLVASSSTPQCL